MVDSLSGEKIMATKDLIKEEIDKVEEGRLEELYEVVRSYAHNDAGSEPTLMDRLREIKIDAPEDFATNFDRYLNGENVTEAIRTPEVSMAASKVSVVPGVRRALIPLQRGIAEESSVVMEGRDIGSVVFPDAKIKVYLDAKPGERARRRALELQDRGESANVEAVTASLQERDERDRTRQEAPLLQAPDAQLIDSTGLSLDEVEEKVLQLVRSRTSNGKEVSR